MSERRRTAPLLSTEAHAERVREKTVTPDRSLHSLDTAASQVGSADPRRALHLNAATPPPWLLKAPAASVQPAAGHPRACPSPLPAGA